MILIEHLKDGLPVVKILVVVYSFEFQAIVKVVVYTYLFFACDVKLLHGTGSGYPHALLQLLIQAADYISKDILIGKPEIKKINERHDAESDKQPYHILEQVTRCAVLIFLLKAYDLLAVNNQKQNRQNAVVKGKLGKRFS